MTDEQHLALAKITFLNTSIIGAMAETLYGLLEEAHALLPNARVLSLLSEIEQLQASLVHVQGHVETCKKDLGL